MIHGISCITAAAARRESCLREGTNGTQFNSESQSDLYGHLIPGGNKQAVDRLDGSTELIILKSYSAPQPYTSGS
jgi:hypothetical protein